MIPCIVVSLILWLIGFAIVGRWVKGPAARIIAGFFAGLGVALVLCAICFAGCLIIVSLNR